MTEAAGHLQNQHLTEDELLWESSDLGDRCQPDEPGKQLIKALMETVL